ncbi:MAG TPA: response regulator [candidate division Zixibacteria bacterium]|jgi:DNA-binding NtrC family response regulator
MNRPDGVRILVIDDELFVRDLLHDFFTKLDYSVTAAPDGDAGLHACRNESFDVALVDLKMPGRGGIEVLSEIVRLDSSLPVVMMTGYPTIDSSIEAIRRGAYDYIIKPFKLQDLKELTERAIKERSFARQIDELKTRLTAVESELRRYRLQQGIDTATSPGARPAVKTASAVGVPK